LGHFFRFGGLYSGLAAFIQVWRIYSGLAHLYRFGGLYSGLSAFIQVWRIYSGLAHLHRFGGLYSGLSAFIQVWRHLFRFGAFIHVWRPLFSFGAFIHAHLFRFCGIYLDLAHLFRFGGLLVQFHPNLLESLQPQLSSPRLAVRKRAIICLGYLVMSCDQILYIKASIIQRLPTTPCSLVLRLQRIF
jgi:hypothetical protein